MLLDCYFLLSFPIVSLSRFLRFDRHFFARRHEPATQIIIIVLLVILVILVVVVVVLVVPARCCVNFVLASRFRS